MSWPAVKPPWKQVHWLQWGDPKVVQWPVPPSIKWSLLLPIEDVSGALVPLKKEIEKLDSIGEWEFLKRGSNPYELVFSQSQDQRIPASVCSLRPLSRSFFKMTEILTVLDFFKRHTVLTKKVTPIVTAHVCEGPGGFIESLLFLSSKYNYSVEHAWAMTLKPTKANIPGWRRAYTFLRKSPMVHIEYGSDETGDILVAENQASFLSKAGGKCNLFTADGGFDFSEHYSTQEDEVFPLLVSSALIGLQTMAKGGDFVLKLFDMDLPSTQQLIAVLAYCFDSWTLYKPALSRPCNAEKYFLGKGCRFVPVWAIKLLSDLRDGYVLNESRVISIFPQINEKIQEQILKIHSDFLENQIMALEHALKQKDEWNANPEALWKSINEHSVSWCKAFSMPLKR